MHCHAILATLVLLLPIVIGQQEKSVAKLSYHNLKKAVSNFEVVLVKFDESFPVDDDKDKEFRKLANDLRVSDNVLVVELTVPYKTSDEGKEDRKLAENLQAAEREQLPAIFLFKKGEFEKPVKFEGSDKFNSQSLRNFIRSTVPGIRLRLESCIPAFDELAQVFTASQADKRKSVLSETKEMTEKNKNANSKVYLKIMEKILERGDMFVESERQRIHNLMTDSSNKMSDQKKAQLQGRLNILESFMPTIDSTGDAFKTEL